MKQYALLVGVSCFQNNLSSLSYVEDDVNAFCNVLVDHFKLQSEDIEYLTNSLATKEAVMSTVDALCQKAVPGDRVILYLLLTAKQHTTQHICPLMMP